MKTFSFAASFLISAVFLSCSPNEDNEDNTPGNGSKCKIAANQVPEHIKELDDYKELDPSCKSEDKKLIVFVDFSPKEIDWDYVYSHLPGYVPGSGIVSEHGSSSQGNFYYNVNGIEMTQAEYDAYQAEYWRKYYEELEKNERKLDIPCSIGGNIALLTEEEIAELKEKYNYLAIDDYIESVPAIPSGDGDEGGTITIPPPEPCGGNG